MKFNLVIRHDLEFGEFENFMRNNGVRNEFQGRQNKRRILNRVLVQKVRVEATVEVSKAKELGQMRPHG